MAYKVVVIGGGPGGYTAAIRAAQLGASVALVEKDQLGGTCLNRGCIPTKALVSGAETLAAVRSAGDFGIDVAGISLDYARLAARKNQVVGQLVKGLQFLLKKKHKIEVINGVGRIIAPGRVMVETGRGESVNLEAENIIVATGSRPALIPALGYDGENVITSDEVWQLNKLPGEMLIIGGGVIGCEFAGIFAEYGVKVTVIEAMPTILPTADREAARQLQSLLKRRGIAIKTKTKVEKVKKEGNKVAVVLEGGETISADKILISIGRAFNTDNLGLKEAGVELGQKGEVLVNRFMQTNVPGIYAIGDITDKIQLAHVASAQGLVAVDNIMGRSRAMDYRVVPSCIFTSPEVAGVGLTTQQASDEGIKVKTGKFPFMASGKAQAMGETSGFVKVLVDPESDKILGVHIVGPHASDLIAEAALAIQLGATAEQVANTIHAHPTLAEALAEAAEAVHGRAINI
ncbi:dihydrolipoamide dehydrogenase [Desulfohalotomaculum tongense]|uniref:dihydrolipoyl dehydrogenase n=1 Tax=Desulforadius tongensis TaxID=1216062 RepID=UPI0019571F40|nr:dihydrolipoyl dehydrogenase [Desulforadius tongensis]MBM7855365.1 dihydrolipoamide dehydrogenase [Desulforadius tongensis]